MLPSLHISCKPFVPGKHVQLYSTRCHCNKLCSHPRGVFPVHKPECVMCMFMLEIRVVRIHLLRSTIPPLRRIWKELPLEFLYTTCCYCANISTRRSGKRSVAPSQYMSYAAWFKGEPMAFCHLSKNRWCNRTNWELRRCRDNGTNIATQNSLSRLVQSSKSSPQLPVRRINRRASQYSKHAEKRTCGESKEARKIAGTQQSRKERNNYSRLDKKSRLIP
jgi:hypothetical protein